jgi:hypothetical protein
MNFEVGLNHTIQYFSHLRCIAKKKTLAANWQPGLKIVKVKKQHVRMTG